MKAKKKKKISIDLFWIALGFESDCVMKRKKKLFRKPSKMLNGNT